MSDREIIVTLDHIRRLRLCAKGTRAVVIKTYGEVAWKHFLKHGATVEQLGHCPNPDIMAAIALAKREHTQ